MGEELESATKTVSESQQENLEQSDSERQGND